MISIIFLSPKSIKSTTEECFAFGISGSSLSNVRSSPKICQIDKYLLNVFLGLILDFMLSNGPNEHD